MKDVRVFFACFFGALIGGIIAREIGTDFWWFGSIAGFIVGYLSYEFRVVVEGIRQAWSSVTGIDVAEIAKITMHVLLIALLFVLALFCFCAASIGMLYQWVKLFSGNVLGSLISSVATVIAGCVLYFMFSKKEEKTYLMFIATTPLAVAFYWLPKGLFWTVKKAPTFVNGVGRFSLLTIRYIHSEERTVCSVYAAIGAGVGYFVGDVLIGALFGGVFGLLNYKIVRTYLLKPATAEAE